MCLFETTNGRCSNRSGSHLISTWTCWALTTRGKRKWGGEGRILRGCTKRLDSELISRVVGQARQRITSRSQTGYRIPGGATLLLPFQCNGCRAGPGYSCRRWQHYPRIQIDRRYTSGCTKGGRGGIGRTPRPHLPLVGRAGCQVRYEVVGVRVGRGVRNIADGRPGRGSAHPHLQLEGRVGNRGRGVIPIEVSRRSACTGISQIGGCVAGLPPNRGVAHKQDKQKRPNAGAG